MGDLLTLPSVSTVSNSPVIICPDAHFVGGDRHKLIEVFGGGNWCGISNQTLIAYITKVISPTKVTINHRAGVTASKLAGCYGTDDAVGFRKAIAHARRPTGTIIIPAGNYLLAPREAIDGYPGGTAHVSSLCVTRGGLTFEGQGKVTLTQAGWVRNGQAIGSGSSGERGAMFRIQAPMANNHPLIFKNLIFFGGENQGWIHNIGFPSSDQTGLGWDESHHALSFEDGNGGNFVNSVQVENCAFHGWRGEVLITTYASTNTFMTVSNCFFGDNNATALNVHFAHLWIDDVFSNMDQVEEFYRDYATVPSVMTDCIITNAGVVALNGGYYFDPTYTITRNTFLGDNWTLYTCPACDVVFSSNDVQEAQGLGIGTAGYQDSTYNTCNSNILIAWNTFNGPQYAFQSLAGGQDMSEEVYFVSNNVENAWGIGSGYGYSTNVIVANNQCQNVCHFDEAQLKGQWFLDVSNDYTGIGLNNSQTLTNLFSYRNGRLGIIIAAGPGSVFALDDTQPEKIPPGATMTISNAWPATFALYPNASLSGKPINLAAGTSATFNWTGHDWVSNH